MRIGRTVREIELLPEEEFVFPAEPGETVPDREVDPEDVPAET